MIPEKWDLEADVVVVGFGAEEGVVELDQHAPVLGVACVGAVQHDPGDAPAAEGLVVDVFVLAHRFCSCPG